MPEYSQICHMAVWSRQGWVPKMLTHMQDLTQKHSFIAGSMIAETKLRETRKWTNKQNTQPANEGDRDTRLQKLNTGVNQSKVKTPGEHSWQQSNSWDRGKQTWTRIGYYQSKTGSMGNTHIETQTDETQGERARDEKVLLKILSLCSSYFKSTCIYNNTVLKLLYWCPHIYLDVYWVFKWGQSFLSEATKV